jgi:copper chaperone
MIETHVYTVPGMSCAHCERAVETELSDVPGVASVTVDLATKTVAVAGEKLSDDALRQAIEFAGYAVDR